jgi:hypothetical protein
MKCPVDISLIIKGCPKNESLRLYLKETETQGIGYVYILCSY